MSYVIRQVCTDGGQYLARPDVNRTYTHFLCRAQVFDKKHDAESYCDHKKEVVIPYPQGRLC